MIVPVAGIDLYPEKADVVLIEGKVESETMVGRGAAGGEIEKGRAEFAMVFEIGFLTKERAVRGGIAATARLSTRNVSYT